MLHCPGNSPSAGPCSPSARSAHHPHSSAPRRPRRRARWKTKRRSVRSGQRQERAGASARSRSTSSVCIKNSTSKGYRSHSQLSWSRSPKGVNGAKTVRATVGYNGRRGDDNMTNCGRPRGSSNFIPPTMCVWRSRTWRPGARSTVGGQRIRLSAAVPMGHKIATRPLALWRARAQVRPDHRPRDAVGRRRATGSTPTIWRCRTFIATMPVPRAFHRIRRRSPTARFWDIAARADARERATTWPSFPR